MRVNYEGLPANSTETCYSVNSHESDIDKVWTEVSLEVPETCERCYILYLREIKCIRLS